MEKAPTHIASRKVKRQEIVTSSISTLEVKGYIKQSAIKYGIKNSYPEAKRIQKIVKLHLRVRSEN